MFRLHLVAPWAASIVRHARLLAVVRAVLDTANVLVWSSDLTVRGAWRGMNEVDKIFLS